MQAYKSQLLVMEQELQQKEADNENKSKVLERLMHTSEDLKKDNLKLSQKLKVIQQTQLKEMLKKLKDKDSELEVLKEMLRSA